MSEYRFIEPIDVLYLRGNHLFDGAGAYGASLMPPWPSLVAGAIRSRMLADSGVEISEYANGKLRLDGPLNEVLGTPSEPGSFSVSHLGPAMRGSDGNPTPLYPVPADTVLHKFDDGEMKVHQLGPSPLSRRIQTSIPVQRLPLLSSGESRKSDRGWWLTEEGMNCWIRGDQVNPGHLIETGELWQFDHRLGIGLDRDTRTASEGQLYTAETVACKPGVGFIAGIDGADGQVPEQGLLRFGGDGRGAVLTGCEMSMFEPDWDVIEKTSCCRILLTTPGIFPEGWRLPGQEEDGKLNIHGLEAEVVSASVPRGEVVSGWDLARWKPKPAQRVAPVGSVYWLKLGSGSVDVLKRLVDEGLPLEDPQRRAEGFNRVRVSNW